MTTSGTYNAFINNGDVVLEAFDRCEIRPTEITRERIFSARRSINLELQTWSNRGVNLWKVQLLTVPLVQGVATYTLPATTISMLDVYVRQFQLSNTLIGGAPAFSTVLGSPIVAINFPNHGLTAGNFFNLETPVSVGGVLVNNFQQVTTVIDLNNFTITLGVNATSTVNNGGVLPTFGVSAGSANITVVQPVHGLVPGLAFNAQLPTVVGGITVQGTYIVQSVIDLSTFVIVAPYEASATQTLTMNLGAFTMATQDPNAQPIDIILTPLGRSEYAAQPNKFTQAKPTSFWFNRETPQPQMVLWQVPDANGPYLLSMYVLVQIQDANVINGQTADIPYRFQEALCSGMAKRLALKFAPSKFALLKGEAKEAWDEAWLEDREKVDVHIVPDMTAYYRGT